MTLEQSVVIAASPGELLALQWPARDVAPPAWLSPAGDEVMVLPRDAEGHHNLHTLDGTPAGS
jgi:hypothetical protein